MASSEEEWNDPFAVLNEPFVGLNEMDFELHGIYMDHEPEDEFMSTLDKCKDNFLNVLLNDVNLRNASMSDEMSARVYHENDWESDKDDEEDVQPKYRVHDPNIKWDKMEPKLGDILESAEQLKFCVANYVVSHGYQIYFAKCDSGRIVVKCGKRNEDNQCPFRLHAAWMYKERSLQTKTMTRIHKCSGSFMFGSIMSPKWIGRHYMTEIANKPNLKLREMISDIKQTFRCDVSIGQYGCFLKGEVKGELLTTIGRDVNNQVYPIASDVVDVENKPNWTWFLEPIHDDIMLDGSRWLVIISDQHKELQDQEGHPDDVKVFTDDEADDGGFDAREEA
ncbi:unnamed protein product [Lactuca saligna]|uniref:MULE transposase domain-containing protein n=1 Tax=Lactuca saligna TaxID=75948 RepID=A0AA35Y518_LACSI|nr:unnamed protein product [Lactuca saligna]